MLYVLDGTTVAAIRPLVVDEDAGRKVDLPLEGLAGELVLKSSSAHRGYVDVR